MSTYFDNPSPAPPPAPLLPSLGDKTRRWLSVVALLVTVVVLGYFAVQVAQAEWLTRDDRRAGYDFARLEGGGEMRCIDEAYRRYGETSFDQNDWQAFYEGCTGHSWDDAY